MRRFLSLILLLLSLNCFAQFKTIHADATTFFRCHKSFQVVPYGEKQTGSFIPIKIESIRIVNEDTLYDNFRVFSLTGSDDPECYATSKGYAWTGKNIIITKDHQEIFINSDGDSLIFKKYTKTNDSWIFFQTEQNHFVATVTSKGLETFKIYEDQVTDSVLTLSISLKKNADNSPLSHPFNDKEWKISKKYGFVRTYDLLYFPNDTNALELSWVDKFNVGVQNLTEKEIYDFEVGDEFHIKEFEYGSDRKKVAQKVLEKSLNEGGDSVIYKISIVENIDKRYYEGEVLVDKVKAKLDTIYMKVALQPDLKGINEIPGKAYSWSYFEWNSDSYNFQFLQVEAPSVMVKAVDMLNGFARKDDSCYQRTLSGGFLIEKYEYWKGLGGPYYIKKYDFPPMAPYGRELVYYKKANEEWGTPMEFILGVYHNKINTSVTLSPNPSTDRIKISSEGIQNTYYKVYNSEGREVLNGNFLNNEETLDINDLRAGIYSIMIMKEGGVIYTSRFVKN